MSRSCASVLQLLQPLFLTLPLSLKLMFKTGKKQNSNKLKHQTLVEINSI